MSGNSIRRVAIGRPVFPLFSFNDDTIAKYKKGRQGNGQGDNILKNKKKERKERRKN